METLVADTGSSVIVIYSVTTAGYSIYRDEIYKAAPYWAGDYEAARLRLIAAREVVTFNGEHHDLRRPPLARTLNVRIPLSGAHVDMLIELKRLGPAFLGKLPNIFTRVFSGQPMSLEAIPGDHDGYVAEQRDDVYMTFMLWNAWRQGKLTRPAS